MEGDPDFDVLIVGLGPVGAVAANILGQAGHEVLVVDQTDGAGLRPRAGGLDDENLRLLQSIGLSDKFLQNSRPLAAAQVVSSYLPDNEDGPSPYNPALEEPVLLNGMQAPEGVGRPGSWPQVPDVFWPGRNGYPLGAWGFYQPRFEEILRMGMARFENVSTRLSTRFISFDQTESHVAVTLQPVKGSWLPTPGNEVSFRFVPKGEAYSVKSTYVIGCDGARSAVRKAMGGIGMVSLEYDERWWACDVKLLRPEEDLWGKKLPYFSQLIADPRRSYTIVPLWQVTDRGVPGRHVRFDIQVAAGDKEDDMHSPEKIQRLISPWLDPEDYELVRFAIYRFWSLLANEWRCGRVFLAGDACHTMPPFLGQGMNQGLKDVNNLCWKLSAVLNGVALSKTLLNSYQEERKPLVQAVVQGSLEVGHMMERLKFASLEGHKVLEQVALAGRGRGLESGLLLANSKLNQSTDESRAYPRLLGRSGRDTITGKTLPQFRVVGLGSNAVPQCLDDVLWPNGATAFVLLAMSKNGMSPPLSIDSHQFLAGVHLTMFSLALNGSADKAQECKHHVAAGEQLHGFDRFVPFVALVRPDRFVLACTKLENCHQLLHELAQYLGIDKGVSKL